MIILYQYLFEINVVHDPKKEIRKSEKQWLRLKGDWIGIKTFKRPRLNDTQLLLLYVLPEHRKMDFGYFKKLLMDAIEKLEQIQNKQPQTIFWLERKVDLLKSFISVIEIYTKNINFWDHEKPKCSLLDYTISLATVRLQNVANDAGSIRIDSESDSEPPPPNEAIKATLGRFQIKNFDYK